MESALAELGEADRALVVLRYRNGLELAELAEAFGLREGTVRMRLSRALARMRAALEAREGARAAYGEVAATRGAPLAARGGLPAPGAPPPPAAAAPFGGPPPARARLGASTPLGASPPLGALGAALVGLDEAPAYEARLAALVRATFG